MLCSLTLRTSVTLAAHSHISRAALSADARATAVQGVRLWQKGILKGWEA